MALTLKQRQQKLDEGKWLESEKQGVDVSGIMVICDYCTACTNNTCTATQDQRETDSLCAKAYNKMQKANKSK